jgi:hypothetical protein
MQKDDVELLREMVLGGRTELEVSRNTGWSHHRIKRIKHRAYKDGRSIPPFKDAIMESDND